MVTWYYFIAGIFFHTGKWYGAVGSQMSSISGDLTSEINLVSS